MFHVVLSVALAASTPQGSTSALAETAKKLNAVLPEQEKFIIPSPGSRQLYDRINSFKVKGSKAETTKDVLKIADLSIQGCNAYSSAATIEHISPMIEGFKIAREQVAREGNFNKAQSLARMSLMVAQCKGPFIVNSIGLSWLQQSVTLLKSVTPRKIKKDDKMRLQALKDQIMQLSTQEILQDSLRFEILSSATLITDALEKGGIKDYKDATPKNSDLWISLNGQKPFTTNWTEVSKISTDLLNTVQKPKSTQFPEYHSELEKQYDQGLQTMWGILDLKSAGFEKPEDMHNDAKFAAWLQSLKTNETAAKTVQQQLSSKPEAATAAFQMTLKLLAVSEESMTKFDSKIKDLQTTTKTLIK